MRLESKGFRDAIKESERVYAWSAPRSLLRKQHCLNHVLLVYHQKKSVPMTMKRQSEPT